MKPAESLEMVVDRQGDELRLLSPEAGLFTGALEAGAALAPGQAAGTLVGLGRATRLRVPDGVYGLVTTPLPERVRQPVGYHQLLYTLAPLDGAQGKGAGEEEEAEGAALVLVAPGSGRFYHRPTPDEPTFVSPGDVLEEGSVVGLIEVMKTFTHVLYRPDGGLPPRARVVRLTAEDGGDVTGGDALVEIEPA